MSGALPLVNGRDTVVELFGEAAIPKGANAGLVFDRFMRVWSRDGREVLKKEPRSKAMQAFVEKYERTGTLEAMTSQLAAMHKRMETLGAKPVPMTSTARLAVGLGGEHPLENGMTFDRALGVPMIPGSSVKGMCHHYARVVKGMGDDELRGIFGSVGDPGRGDEEGQHVGDVVFFDALPLHWPKIEVDVLTNHYPDYYGSDNVVTAYDWEEPNPVEFLVVEAKTTFCFYVLSRSGSSEQLELVEDLLVKGLATLGIGGKTAVGYGVFRR